MHYNRNVAVRDRYFMLRGGIMGWTRPIFLFLREKGWAKREFHDDWGWVIVSLHDRHFMSQVGRRRYFAWSASRVRSARRGEQKNKALRTVVIVTLTMTLFCVMKVKAKVNQMITIIL